MEYRKGMEKIHMPTLNQHLSPSHDHSSLVRQGEIWISNLLRSGVIASSMIILIGIVHYFVSGDRQDTSIHSLTDIFVGISHGDPLAIIMLGLLVLLATPIARVAISVITFAIERDWRYVSITLTVLLILLTSFLLGKGG
jgi:uncharacterized membrane protein